MQLPDEILSECTRVAIIYALSLPLTAIQGVTGAIISCFHMGVEGAALASDFSMFVSCVWTFICARRILKQKTQAKMYFFPPALKKYLTLAIPSIIQSSVLSIGTMALQMIVNKAGIAYINGYTAANTIFNLFLLPIVAIRTGFETFFFLQLFKYSIESLFKAHLKMNLFAAASILSLGCRIAFAFIFTPIIGLSAMAWALLFGSAVSVIFDMCWKHYLKL